MAAADFFCQCPSFSTAKIIREIHNVSGDDFSQTSRKLGLIFGGRGGGGVQYFHRKKELDCDSSEGYSKNLDHCVKQFTTCLILIFNLGSIPYRIDHDRAL